MPATEIFSEFSEIRYSFMSAIIENYNQDQTEVKLGDIHLRFRVFDDFFYIETKVNPFNFEASFKTYLVKDYRKEYEDDNLEEITNLNLIFSFQTDSERKSVMMGHFPEVSSQRHYPLSQSSTDFIEMYNKVLMVFLTKKSTEQKNGR